MWGPLLTLFVSGILVATIVFRRKTLSETSPAGKEKRSNSPGNPLELNSAFLFAFSYVVISFLTHWVHGAFGVSGIYVLACLVGFTDIVPFILSVVHPGSALPMHVVLVSTMVAASSNNIVKGAYLLVFWGRREGLPALLSLLGLAAGGGLLVLLFRM
jgi:uncharacterized membrane protein (DUF4010 family)